jgi:glucose/arabinose dehydrogenase
VWGTDNGRDLLGDDTPPDEVNILSAGKNYGWPICYGANVHDTDFDKNQYIRDPCADKTPPQIELHAHSAGLGLAFIPEEGWPEDMYNDLLVAYHGSWNRSQPTGYKVVRFNLDPTTRKPIGEPIDFLTGFLTTNNTNDAIGRPVGLLAEPGGVVYVSDDRAGAIYKIALQ